MTSHDGDTEHLDTLEPDPEPQTVPPALVEEDEDRAASGLVFQTVAFAVGVILIVLLVLILASGRGLDFFNFFGADDDAYAPLDPRLSGVSIQGSLARGQAITDTGTFEDGTPRPAVDALFADYWVRNGGATIFGFPESPLLEENGRRFQWFQRARLEYWPENAPPYDIQPGLIGVEFTKNRDFPQQEFFTNRPGLRYEAVTGHGLRGEFLRFWEENGGLAIFGYPISDEIQEVLPEDGAIHTVQYFERARFELHADDPAQPIKLGLIGTALYRYESEPEIIAPVKPTAVPVTP